ncbi:hypothetical protein J3R83DRAFT_1749 [Lanmaoa asiatica]|nr:hypothetical protein J3R83DRAFT_1749 [Lanmaoa asiatica]
MRSSFTDILPVYGLVALCLTPSVAANYYVDNANTTIAYAASGTDWRTFSFATQNLTLDVNNENITIDSSKCYNQNYNLVAACTVDNKCQITFPFTGSGISVYVIHAGFQGISASLTIDGGQSATTSLPPPAPPSYQTPNVSLFNIQSLPSADHTATINLLDWNGGTTSLYFDYALINETHVELSVSSSATFLPQIPSTTSDASSSTAAIPQSATTQPANTSSTSPTTISTSASSTYTPKATSAVPITDSSVNLGAVVGGAFGGLAALITIVTAIIFLKKRNAQYAALEESRKPDPFPVTPSPASVPMVPLPVCPQTNQKRCMRPAACETALYRSPRRSDGESDDFYILSTVGNAGRIPEAEAGP